MDQQQSGNAPIASVRSGFSWTEVTQAQVDSAQRALDTLSGNSPYWDSDEGQDAIAITRAFRLKRTTHSYRPPLYDVCQTCGARHCYCSRGHRSDRFDVASGRRS